jgi:hypothetical protein
MSIADQRMHRAPAKAPPFQIGFECSGVGDPDGDSRGPLTLERIGKAPDYDLNRMVSESIIEN